MASFLPSLVPCYLLLLLPFLAVAQTTGIVSLGSSLTAGAAEAKLWLSPSSDFILGFHQLEDVDFFLLAIWYNKIPGKAIVWYANGNNPAPRGSKVELTADRGLVLSNPQDEVMWRSDFAAGEVSYALMNDDGNFVVFNRNSQPLWESFRNPTDAMLPTQVMQMNDLLYSGQTETHKSRWTEANPRCPIPDTKMYLDSFLTSVSELIYGFLSLSFVLVGIVCTVFISHINKLTRTRLPDENAALKGLDEDQTRESNIRQRNTTYVILGISSITFGTVIIITYSTIY